MTLAKVHDQRFMVSPCGYMYDYFDVSEIADEAPGWTDCTDMSDIELRQLIERRMAAADRRKEESRWDNKVSMAEFDRMYESGRI